MSFFDPAEIRDTLEGLRHDFFKDNNASYDLIQKVAPLMSHETLRGEYFVPNYERRPVKNATGNEAGDFTTPRPASLQYDAAAYTLKTYMSEEVRLAQRRLDILGTVGINALKDANDQVMAQMLGIHASNLEVAAAALTAGTSMDISGASADVYGQLYDDLYAMRRATGVQANTLICGEDVVRRLLDQDQLRDAVALGAASGRRTGVVTAAEVKAWFAAKLNLELIVPNFLFADGTASFDGKMVLCKRDGNQSTNTFMTAHRDQVIGTKLREDGMGDAVNVMGVVAYSDHAVVNTHADLGRSIAVTLA
jgi:superfamily I DNA/RNA helicase